MRIYFHVSSFPHGMLLLPLHTLCDMIKLITGLGSKKLLFFLKLLHILNACLLSQTIDVNETRVAKLPPNNIDLVQVIVSLCLRIMPL